MPHRRRLRSAATEQLDVPTCRRSTIGGRAFPAAGAKVWNGLPSEVTSASSLSVFKNRLKTYLFRRCYEAVWLSVTFPFPSHYLPPQNSGPCNSFYCLGHFKNVCDDDDDDWIVFIVYWSVWTPTRVCKKISASMVHGRLKPWLKLTIKVPSILNTLRVKLWWFFEGMFVFQFGFCPKFVW